MEYYPSKFLFQKSTSGILLLREFTNKNFQSYVTNEKKVSLFPLSNDNLKAIEIISLNVLIITFKLINIF